MCSILQSTCMSPVVRYSPFAGFLIYLALTGANASAAEDSDYEIIDIELLQEDNEDSVEQEKDAKNSPVADNADTDLQSDQTDPASETTINAAYTALQNQEYDVAYDWFYSLASQGNAVAQYELGALYHQGAGVDKDALRAAYWYERAAQQEYAEAQYRLGNMYLMGEGVRQSDTEAAHWFEKAAQQGHTDAGSNLVSLKRISSAKTREELEREAASLPPLKAMDKTADGRKTEKSGFFKRWFRRDNETRALPDRSAENPAAAQEVISASQSPAEPVKPESASAQSNDITDSTTSKTGKKGFFSRLFRKGGKKDEKTPADLKPTANNPGSTASTGGTAAQRPDPVTGSTAVSNYELAMAHASGDALEQDYTKAFEYFTRSGQQGYAPAQYQLGMAYANGDGIEINLDKAVEWYEKSAEQGHIIAQRSLALIYLNGQEGISQNKPLALAWYNLLAENGNQMDIHRRNTLLQELSDAEIRLSQDLKTKIQNRLNAERE